MELEELKAEIEDLHTKRQFSAIKTILNQLNPADIAQLLEEFSNEERLLFFRLLGKEEAADTFVELEPDNQEALIHAFSDNELREVLDELYLDDTVDMIEEMPATVVKRILRNTDVETRASINTLLRYPEDSAGSIMTPEFVDLRDHLYLLCNGRLPPFAGRDHREGTAAPRSGRPDRGVYGDQCDLCEYP